METNDTPGWKRDYQVLRANPERWERHKATVRRRQRERYASDPEFRDKHKAGNLEAQKRAIRDPEGWSRRMLVRIRHKCKKTGIPFNLTVADLAVPLVCPVFGTPFVMGGADGYKDWHSPSVDRVKPDLGYVTGNVCIISVRANTIKNDATADELRLIAAYIDNNSN
jgi:hypothetical protein